MSIHAEIQALYLTVYNRPADWGGLLYWAGQLENRGFEAMSGAFTQAPEFDEMYGGLSSRAQIGKVYQHLLGREADEDGLAYWAAKIDAGEPVATVARSIGDAAKGYDGEAFDQRIDDAQEQTYGELVDVLYAGYYGRGSDPEGRAFWTQELKGSGGDLSAVIKAFGNSQEYVEQYGALNSEQQVTKLYQNLFDRDPEDEGLTYWAGKLDRGELPLSQIAFTIAEGASGSDRQALEETITEFESEPELEYIEFPTSSGYVDSENGWYIYASISDVDQTSSIYLRKVVGEVDSLTAILEFEAVTRPEGFHSDSYFPQDDVLPPVLDFRYVGISNAYSVDNSLSSLRVDGYQSRKIYDINEITWDNHRANFDSGNDRELSVFDSPDGYDGLLDEMLTSEKVYVKIVPDNPYFPTIENGVSLDGFEEMLEIFDDLSVRREDNIYGNSENNSENMLLEENIAPISFVEIA